MASITFRRPTTYPVHPKGWVRPPGNVDFVVTQDYDDPDGYVGGQHRAVDLGNGRCNDLVVAMAPGIAYRVRDDATAAGATTDALGIAVDHGYGVTTEYWHLSSYAVANGTRVQAGTIVGRHGSTGLSSGCHIHVEAKRNGVRFDPEPLIFGGSVTIGGAPVKLPPGLQAVMRGTVAAGVRLRLSPWNIDGAIVTATEETIQVFGKDVAGQKYTLGGVTGNLYAWIGRGGYAYFVAKPLVTKLRLGAGTEVDGGVASAATMDAISKLAASAKADVDGIVKLAG